MIVAVILVVAIGAVAILGVELLATRALLAHFRACCVAEQKRADKLSDDIEAERVAATKARGELAASKETNLKLLRTAAKAAELLKQGEELSKRVADTADAVARAVAKRAN